MHAVGDLVGRGDLDAREPSGLQAAAVFGEGQGTGDAADVVAAFGSLFWCEVVVSSTFLVSAGQDRSTGMVV